MMLMQKSLAVYCNLPGFSDRYASAINCKDPGQLLLEAQSDQGLHCFPFYCMQFSEANFFYKAT